ncbi:hypothetical protein BC943DRAFT_381098 [Umbelopsis sp. AD052]|nr:hypothetical protein BC943DRAFT_381098 [Umbelopsis sp. AD052]
MAVNGQASLQDLYGNNQVSPQYLFLTDDVEAYRADISRDHSLISNEPITAHNADYALEVWEEENVAPRLLDVNEDFFQRFEAAFQKMIPEEKWTLSIGKIVENELFKLGKKCKFEQ